MSYSLAALIAVAAVIVIDMAVLRTRLVTRRLFWTSYAIVLFFQLIVNGILTGIPVVTYSPAAIWGPRLVFAPVEDVLFGFAMVTLTLSVWVAAGRRSHAPAPARPPTRGAAAPPPPAR